jgi:hypothetical protein
MAWKQFRKRSAFQHMVECSMSGIAFRLVCHAAKDPDCGQQRGYAEGWLDVVAASMVVWTAAPLRFTTTAPIDSTTSEPMNGVRSRQ